MSLIYLNFSGSTRTSFLPSSRLRCVTGEIITSTELRGKLRKIDLPGEAAALPSFLSHISKRNKVSQLSGWILRFSAFETTPFDCTPLCMSDVLLMPAALTMREHLATLS